MDITNQDGSAATETTVSDNNQNNSTEPGTTSSSDTVAYDTHKRLLGEKKKLQSKYEQSEVELNELREAKLSAEGKKDELLDAYKKRVAEMEAKVNNFAYSSVSNAVRLKAKEMGCISDDKLVKHLDLSTLTIGDGFQVDSDEVKTMLENAKKEMGFFFKTVNPNVNNDVPNANPNLENGRPDFSKMSREELAAFGKKHGL